MRDRKVMAQELPFRSGFHSPLFEPFVSGLAAQFADLVLEPPTVPLWSATIGAPYPEGHDDIADLAVRHLVEPVRFRELVERLHLVGGQPQHRALERLEQAVLAGEVRGADEDELPGLSLIHI